MFIIILLQTILTTAILTIVLNKIIELEQKDRRKNERIKTKIETIENKIDETKIEIEEVLEEVNQENKATHKVLLNDFKKIKKDSLELINEMKIISSTMEKTIIVDSREISNELFEDILDNDQYIEELAVKIAEIKEQD